MSNKMIDSLIKINKEEFISSLHKKGISIRELDDPSGVKGINRTEKTIRRWLEKGEMPAELYSKITDYVRKREEGNMSEEKILAIMEMERYKIKHAFDESSDKEQWKELFRLWHCHEYEEVMEAYEHCIKLLKSRNR